MPDENSVAQARWAEKSMTNFQIDDKLLNIPRSFEARTWKYIYEEDISSALNNSILWLVDQPFSLRPIEIASSLAGLLEEYSKSIEIAEYGLNIDPNNSLILNGLAFIYASDDKLDEAKNIFSKMRVSDLNENLRVCKIATDGLIHFRSGNIEQGRKLYLDSIDLAKKYGLDFLVERATLYLAREELIAGIPTAEETFKKGMSISKDTTIPGHSLIKNQVLKLYNEKMKSE